MKNAEREKQSEPLFEYSAAQFVEISAAVQAVRPRPLSNAEQKVLHDHALIYRRGLLNPKWSPQKKLKEWQKAAQGAEQLKRHLLLCIERTNAEERDYFWTTLLMLEKLKRSASEAAQYHGSTSYHLLFGNSRENLKVARFKEDPERTARLDYEWKIMGFWVDVIGGAPTTTWQAINSDGSIKGRVTGALVTFFQAVTVPVMRNKAPNPYGIREIARRYSAYLRVLAAAPKINSGEAWTKFQWRRTKGGYSINID